MALEHVLKAVVITALRKPETVRHLVEVPAVLKHTGLDLCIDCNRVVLVDRKICVGGGCCYQFKKAVV